MKEKEQLAGECRMRRWLIFSLEKKKLCFFFFPQMKVMACLGEFLTYCVYRSSTCTHWWLCRLLPIPVQFEWINEVNFNSLNNSQTFETQSLSTAPDPKIILEHKAHYHFTKAEIILLQYCPLRNRVETKNI